MGADFAGKSALITGVGRGSGITVNAYRRGGMDTAMRARIRRQEPERIGAALHERFNRNFAEGTLITPGQSAAALIAHLSGDDTGAIWDVNAAPSGHEPGHRPATRGTTTAGSARSPRRHTIDVPIRAGERLTPP